MTDSVFPVSSEVITKARLRTWLSGGAWLADYVQSGFTVTDSGGLFCDIAAGIAHAGGVYIARDVATLDQALTANSTNHVYVTIDENDVAGAVVFTINTTGTPPATPNVKLAEVATDATSVTGVTDKRPQALFGSHATLKNAKTLKGESNTLCTIRSLIGLNASNQVEVGDAAVALKLLGSSIDFGGNTVWHAGNDGAGSGLDADTVDGSHASAFATSGHTHTVGSEHVFTHDQTDANHVTADYMVQVADGGRIGYSHGTDENAVRFYISKAGTVRNLRCWVMSASQSVAVTIRKNGADQSVTLSTGTTSNTLVSDTSNSFSVAAGDYLTYKMRPGSTGQWNLHLSFEIGY